MPHIKFDRHTYGFSIPFPKQKYFAPILHCLVPRQSFFKRTNFYLSKNILRPNKQIPQKICDFFLPITQKNCNNFNVRNYLFKGKEVIQQPYEPVY